MKKCPKCGAKNLDKALFCRECGENIKDVEPEQIVVERTSVYKENEISPKPVAISWILPLMLSIWFLIANIINFVSFWSKYYKFNLYPLKTTLVGVLLTIILAYVDLTKNRTNKISYVTLGISAITILLYIIAKITCLFNYQLA